MAKRQPKTAQAIAEWAEAKSHPEPESAQDASSTEPTPVQRIDQPETGLLKRLTAADHALILRMADEGKTQTQIAQRFSVSQVRISQVLADFKDVRPAARKRLESGSLALAERIVAEADPDQAIDVLERLEVLPPRQAQTGGGVVIVNQVAGMAGLPATDRNDT